MKKTTILLSILLLLGIGFIVYRLTGITGMTSVVPGNYDNFAKCITEKGASLYGAEWCGHCQNQKRMFGQSFQHINYVECADGNKQLELCAEKKITAYPTWEINGELIPGSQTIDSLSLKTGCTL